MSRARLPRHRARARLAARPDARATWPWTTTRRSPPSGRVTRLEGIIPALESAHALHFALEPAESALDVVCLSGRGDKDLAEVIARTSGAPGAPWHRTP